MNALDTVVLAGGEGRRLQTLLGQRAKVLAPVAGKPFLDHLLEDLQRQGLRRVVLALGSFHEQVIEHLQRRSFGAMEVTCVTEKRALGTAGAMRHALPSTASDPVLVMNGDTFCDLKLADLLSFHRRREARVTLAAARVSNAGRFGSIEADEADRVVRFLEKGPQRAGYVNCGVYAIARPVIESIPAGIESSWETEQLPDLVGRKLFVYKGSFRFVDIGTPDSYREAASFLERRESSP